VSFNPDVALTMVVPVTGDPAGVGMRRFHVGPGNPDVCVAVPAMIALVPGPAGVLVGRRRNNLDGARWGWADADDDLRLGDACR
jgi:hypothetical protein